MASAITDDNKDPVDFSVIVISKSKIKKKTCPECSSDLRKEYLVCPRKDGSDDSDYLLSYRCDACQQNYMSDSLYETYKNDKKIEAIKFLFHENVLNDHHKLDGLINSENVPKEDANDSINNP